MLKRQTKKFTAKVLRLTCVYCDDVTVY